MQRAYHLTKLLKLFFLLLIGTAGCSFATSESQNEQIQAIMAKYPPLEGKQPEFSTVKRVVDGDTFELTSGEKVRLIGVNTPETVKPGTDVEVYGREASDFTKAQLGGKSVILFQDVSDRDRYGRLLRYVFIDGDSVMFNERLVAEGYAQVSTFPPDVLFADHFQKLQQTAASRQVGLWGAEDDGEEKARKLQGTAALEPSKNGNCPAPTIKGNINSSKEKIYHTKDSPQYEATIPEMWFCTEAEAEAAGFRKAGQK